jgi:hypothetical protein
MSNPRLVSHAPRQAISCFLPSKGRGSYLRFKEPKFGTEFEIWYSRFLDKRKSRKKGTGGEMSGLVQQQIAEEKAEREAQLQRERDAHDQAVREQQVGF